MLFGLWTQPRVAFHDRAFERATLPPWDARCRLTGREPDGLEKYVGPGRQETPAALTGPEMPAAGVRQAGKFVTSAKDGLTARGGFFILKCVHGDPR
jgi:hypothetical protein